MCAKAAFAFGRMHAVGDESTKVMQALITATHDNDAEVRNTAAAALKSLGGEATTNNRVP